MNRLGKGKRFLRLPEVIRMTGLPRSTLYEHIGKKLFPAQVTIGPRAVAWIESEVEQWVDKQMKLAGRAGGDDQVPMEKKRGHSRGLMLVPKGGEA